MNIVNIIFSLIAIVFGCYILYNVYKKPSVLSSTNFSGIIGGLGSIFLGIMSLIGKIDLIQIIKNIFNIK
jgi:hypothetical protein